MSEIRFDPYTGKPVAPQAPPEPEAASSPSKKKKKGGIVTGVIAALIVIGGIFLVTNVIGNPGTPYRQIKKAAEKTFVSDDMTEQLLMAGKMMEDGVYGAEGSFDVSGQKVKVDFDTDKGNLSAGISLGALDGTLYMDDEKITVDARGLGVDPLSYDYASDKADIADSYIGSTVGTENLKTVDTILKMCHVAAGMDKARWEEIGDMVDEKCESLEYEELDKEDVIVHGMIAECEGFSTVVSGEFLAELLDDASEKIFGTSLTDLSSELGSMGSYAGEASGALDQLKGMEDIELKFYIDEEKKLRQIAFRNKTDSQKLDALLSFAGEDIPWYDTVLEDNNSDYYIDLITAEEGDATTYELVVFDYKRLSINYDKSNLDFTVYTSNGDAFLEGSVVNGEDKVTVDLHDTAAQTVNGKIVISDESSVAKAPSAQDVLNMSQADFDQLGNVISRLLYGF